VNADGSDLRRITPFGVGAFSVNWSPDGRLIAFNSDLTQDPQIYVVHPDGTGLLQLTQPTDGDSSFTPVWSPDSTKLLFQRGSFGTSPADRWIMNADGTEPYSSRTRLRTRTHRTGGRHPSASKESSGPPAHRRNLLSFVVLEERATYR
jgi:Tol biopolymer transport system component